jgi:hypothetical protein
MNGVAPGYLPDDPELSTEQTWWWGILELCWAWDPNMRKSAEGILELLTIVEGVNRDLQLFNIDIPKHEWAIDNQKHGWAIDIPKHVWEIERSLRQRVLDIEVKLEDQLAHKEDKFDYTLPGDIGPSPMQLDFIPQSYVEPSPMSTSTRNRNLSNPPSVLMTSRGNSQHDPMIISPKLSGTQHMSISPASVSNLQRTRPQSTKSSVANPSHLRHSTLPE